MAIKGQLILIYSYITLLLLIYLFTIVFEIPQYLVLSNVSFGLVLVIISIMISYQKVKKINKKYSKLDIDNDLAATIAKINYGSHDEDKIISDAVVKICNQYWMLYEQLKSSNQMEHEYINLWVHEIKMPLSNIKIKLERSGDYRQLQEVEKIEDYISKVLYMKRITSMEHRYTLENIDVCRQINGVVKNYKSHIINKEIHIAINCDESNLFTDEFWFKFIISQLISNSIKYQASKITIIKEENKIIVNDNGLGIESKELKKIFDKFFVGTRTKDIYKSSGIGLYLVKQLCDDLNINIEVFSTGNDGTTFTLHFK